MDKGSPQLDSVQWKPGSMPHVREHLSKHRNGPCPRRASRTRIHLVESLTSQMCSELLGRVCGATGKADVITQRSATGVSQGKVGRQELCAESFLIREFFSKGLLKTCVINFASWNEKRHHFPRIHVSVLICLQIDNWAVCQKAQWYSRCYLSHFFF